MTVNRSGADREDWVIIGGGAGGGWLGLRGVERGHRVTIVEQRPGLGGLTRSDELLIHGTPVTVDSFYHVIMESDRRARGLLNELGLEDQIRWSHAPAQIIASGVGYPASSLGEMARLPALKLLDRIRIAASIALSLALPQRLARSLTAERWLRIAAGSSALEAFWRPMLRAKLGTRSADVAASFMVATFRRLVRARLSGAGDRFGVLPGGYRPVFDALADQFTAAGGQIRTDAGVSGVQSEPASDDGPRVVCTLSDGTTLVADRVWVTAPGPAVLSLLPQLSPTEQHQVSAAPYLGVVCATAALEQAPNDAYITYLVDDLGLTGVIGMHALLPPDQTAGAALVYLPRYCAPDDPWFDETDEVLRERFTGLLAETFPDQHPKVLAMAVNRARHVVPLPLPGTVNPLPHTTSIPGVHVVSAVQNTTGTLNVETTLDLASRALAEIEGDR